MMEGLMEIGQASLGTFWAPVAAWTVFAGGAWTVIRRRSGVHPFVRYRLGQALLFALPVALMVGWFTPVGRVAGPALPVASVPGSVVFGSAGAEALSTPLPVSIDLVALTAGAGTLAAMLAAAVGLALISFRLRALGRLARRAQPVTDGEAHRELGRLRALLGVGRPVALLEGSEDSVPITFGWRRPVIVVPSGLADRPDHLRMALVHELVHVARGDFAWAVGEGLTRAAFAFHPLTRVLERDIARHREASCDLDVLATHEAAPGAYARLLFALGTRGAPPYGMAAGLATPKSQLKERIQTMKSFETTVGSSRVRTAMGAVALLAATALLGACFSFNESVVEGEASAPEEVVHPEVQLNPDHPLSQALASLETQLDYLETELDRLQSGTYPDGIGRREQGRFRILSELYDERLRQYEIYRLERAMVRDSR